MTEINQPNTLTVVRRRDLLPIWIKIFLWMFIAFGALATIGLVIGLLGFSFQLSLYGLETYQPISTIGLILTSLFLYKFFVAYNLWTEKDNALLFAKIDAYVGIIICGFVIIIYPFINYNGNFVLSFRLELLAIIPFLIKLNKISDEWKKLTPHNTSSL